MEECSISAVAFTYNEEKYIGSLIDSISLQTVRVNKIIICDDFSTDSTRNVLENKRRQYKDTIEIVILENDRKGKVYAYEKALNFVDTDYFFVCGGDDVVGDRYVEEMLSFIESRSLNFAYANPLWCDQDLKPLKRVKKKTFYEFTDLFYANWVGGFIFAKSVILKDYLPFPPGLEFEDWYVGLLLTKKYELAYVNESSSYFYRRHVNATTAVTSNEKSIYLVERDIRFCDFFSTLGVCEKLIQARKDALRGRVYSIPIKTLLRILITKNFSSTEKLKVVYYQLFKIK